MTHIRESTQMENPFTKLRNCRGDGSVLAIVMVLVIVLIASGVWEFMRLHLIASGVRDALQSAIIAVATANYDDLYNGLREGYSGGYELNDDHWDVNIDIGDLYYQIDSTLGLKRQNGRHEKLSEGHLEYSVSGLRIQMFNAPFAPANSESSTRFRTSAEIDLEVPLSFGCQMLPPLRTKLHAEAIYVPKF